MKISIVIVNYNVEYFLNQCLQSVLTSLKDIEGEIFVVDNNSVDGSVEMVLQKYPQVHLICNKENSGFSKANNQAIRLSKGEYVLLLNPDTLLQDDTLTETLKFMDSNSDAGGLGVQMLDGKGNFLPESKRGLPTPMVAFYKIFGISRLFPKSKKFGKYHLGFLPKNETHSVDVLSGAFMLLRKSVLDTIGYLDESFFMYGEDIDLSYRITQAGYKNYYFPDTKIIHYKGESTKKGSLNYVITFYNAMIIFAKKHYAHSKQKLFIFLIQLAINFRATVAILHRFMKKFILLFSDFFIILSGFFLLTRIWENLMLSHQGGNYPKYLIFIALPIYVCIWLFTSFLNGCYDKKIRIDNILKGVFYGTVIILLLYSLLDVSLRFSRALILLGSLWTFIVIATNRIIAGSISVFKNPDTKKRYIIVGDTSEAERVKNILFKSNSHNSVFIKYISPNTEKEKNPEVIGTIAQIPEIIRVFNINEIIYCAKNLSATSIIESMSALSHTGVDMKIAPQESIFIIGSNSINTAGDVYMMNINNIDNAPNKRSKRTLDIICSMILLTFCPIIIWFYKKPHVFILNILRVLFNYRTWVGYCEIINDKQKLPPLKKGILNPAILIRDTSDVNSDVIHNLNIMYARDYKVSTDVEILWKGFSKLANF